MGVIISKIAPSSKSNIETFEAASKDAFQLTAIELGNLVDYNGIKATDGMEKLCGGIDGLLAILRTDVKKGLSASNVHDHSLRQNCFGRNVLPPKKSKSFLIFCYAAIRDVVFVILLLCGLSSLSVGLLKLSVRTTLRPLYPENVEKNIDWIDGLEIIVAVLIVVLVTALNDYQKDRQFFKLQQHIDEEKKAEVLRDGEIQQISRQNVVVGDICVLNYGCILPADGFLIQGSGLAVDESNLTGETDRVAKDDKNRVLLAGTTVTEGSGLMVVIAVGILSTAGRIYALSSDSTAARFSEREVKKAELVAEHKKEGYVLPAKLTRMQNHLEYIGLTGACCVFLILILKFTINTYGIQRKNWEYDHIYYFIDCVAQAVTIIVVAVPQSLPLSAALALAFAVKRMLADNNLVRHLNACETMGNATVICSDKTGTLTTNKMTVTECYLAGKHFEDISAVAQNISSPLLDILSEAIAINSSYTSILKIDTPGDQIELFGNKTECALLAFTMYLGRNYETFRSSCPENKLVKVFPFNSTRKSMTTVTKKQADSYYIYTKGACETVLKSDARSPVIITVKHKEDILNVFNESMNNTGLRTICIAYRKIPVIIGDFQSWDNEEEVNRDLVFLCIAGIQDPIRPGVPWAIQKCKKAGIQIIMVTGDNISTARYVASRCGIINLKEDFLALDSDEFNELVSDELGHFSQREFDKVWPKLRVLARSSPEDKYVLVNGIITSNLNEEREIVAVTGDGTNDAPALRSADIGFAMGKVGTDIAKQSCDIILLDDDFTSIVNALKWGRNVYDNVAKFLQFQSSANLAAFVFSIVAAVRISRIPLTVIQMMYFNLLLDTIASVGLASEKPTDLLFDRKPCGKFKYIVSPIMFRNILGHAIYQITVTFLLIFKGNELLDVESTIELLDRDPTNNKRTAHFTFVFNAFVLMTLFNQINSRKLHGESNVFKGILDNWTFIIIWLLCVTLQVIIVHFGGRSFSVVHLDAVGWGYSIFFGIGSLFIHQIINLVPPSIISRPVTAIIQFANVTKAKHPHRSPLTFFKIGRKEKRRDSDDEGSSDPAALWLRGTRRLNAQFNAIEIFNNI